MKLRVLFTILFYCLFQISNSQNLGEFNGAFSSWNTLSITTGTNIRSALQTAVDSAGINGHSSNIYLPAGAYTIDSTIIWRAKKGVHIYGANPLTTSITWAGAADGKMFYFNGIAYCSFARLTINGNYSASILIDQSWDNSTGYFDTGNGYTDCIFENAHIGIQGGQLGYGFAETKIERCKFLNFDGSPTAAISLGNFNALDCWVWDCYFDNCIYGVTNTYGAGGFKLYRNIFNNVGVVAKIQSVEGFALRENHVKDCINFIYAGFSDNACQIISQNNVILDCSSYPYALVNQGGMIILGDTIRTLNDADYAQVEGTDKTTVINTVTNSTSGWYLAPSERLINNTVVSHASLNSLALPSFIGFQPYVSRTKIEVTTYTAAGIQVRVDSATKYYNGQKPIVHIPEHDYSLSTGINITSDIQLIGDGYGGGGNGTNLNFSGSDGALYVITADGSRKPVFKDFTITGASHSNGIKLNSSDQEGGQVYASQLELRSCDTSQLYVNRLDYTNTVITNAGFFYGGNASTIGIKVVGGANSNVGVASNYTTIFSATGTPDAGKLLDVQNGAKLVVKDYWKETASIIPKFLNESGKGNISVDGARINAPIDSSGFPLVNADITVNGFNGKLTIIAAKTDSRTNVKGNGTNTNVLLMSNLANDSPYLKNTSSPSADARYLFNRSVITGNNSNPSTNIGVVNNTFIQDQLTDIKAVAVPKLATTAENVTQVLIDRVWVTGVKTGIQITTGTHYYFSQSGNDATGDGSIGNPYKTLTKLNSLNLLPGDVCYLKRGGSWYVETQGGIWTTNSGAAGNNITIDAYGSGEKPILTAGRALSGWTDKGGGVWETTVSDQAGQVTVATLDGVFKPKGRYPKDVQSNATMLYVTTATDMGGSPKIWGVTNSYFSGRSLTGAEITIRSEPYLCATHIILSQHNDTVFIYEQDPNFSRYGYGAGTPSVGHGFTLQQDSNYVGDVGGTIGDWYWNQSAKKFRIYLGSELPTNHVISININNADRDLDLLGQDSLSALIRPAAATGYITYRNLHIDLCTTRGILGEDRSNFIIDSCVFTNIGTDAILSYGNASYWDISNSTFTNILNRSIYVGNSYNLITDNRITNNGIWFGAGKNGDGQYLGILMGQGRILRNRLIDLGTTAISFAKSDDNEIAYNEVRRMSKIFADAGAIYSFGAVDAISPGSYVHTQNQSIHDNVLDNEYTYGAWGVPELSINNGEIAGVYMDDGQNGVAIYNNFIRGFYGIGITTKTDDRFNIHDNVVVGSTLQESFSYGQKFRDPTSRFYDYTIKHDGSPATGIDVWIVKAGQSYINNNTFIPDDHTNYVVLLTDPLRTPNDVSPLFEPIYDLIQMSGNTYVRPFNNHQSISDSLVYIPNSTPPSLGVVPDAISKYIGIGYFQNRWGIDADAIQRTILEKYTIGSSGGELNINPNFDSETTAGSEAVAADAYTPDCTITYESSGVLDGHYFKVAFSPSPDNLLPHQTGVLVRLGPDGNILPSSGFVRVRFTISVSASTSIILYSSNSLTYNIASRLSGTTAIDLVAGRNEIDTYINMDDGYYGVGNGGGWFIYFQFLLETAQPFYLDNMHVNAVTFSDTKHTDDYLRIEENPTANAISVSLDQSYRDLVTNTTVSGTVIIPPYSGKVYMSNTPIVPTNGTIKIRKGKIKLI